MEEVQRIHSPGKAMKVPPLSETTAALPTYSRDHGKGIKEQTGDKMEARVLL